MNEKEFRKILVELGQCTSEQIKEVRKQINEVLAEIEGEQRQVTSQKEPVLREVWHHAEYIDDEDNYHNVKWRTIERLGFYIRPFQTWFFPCPHCQEKLKNIVLDNPWIFGNKTYEPLVEFNRDFKEIDDDSWITIETHKATKEELQRLPDLKWTDLPL